MPKRVFKRAADRNLIRRRIREAYRLNKSELFYANIPAGIRILLGIHYVGKEIADYSFTEKKLKEALKRLSELLTATS